MARIPPDVYEDTANRQNRRHLEAPFARLTRENDMCAAELRSARTERQDSYMNCILLLGSRWGSSHG